MLKEAIICIVIILTIILGNNITQNYTKQSVSKISEELMSLREIAIENEINNKEAKEKIEKAYKQWNERHDKLAYFIEHDELEKIETELTEIRSHIETEEYEELVSELNKSMFLLKHVEDKYAFNLQNVF